MERPTSLALRLRPACRFAILAFAALVIGLGLPTVAGCGAGVQVSLETGTVAPSTSLEADVLRIVDGDTIWVRMADGVEAKVRYIGIDAPEVPHNGSGGEYLGEEATRHNEALLVSGRVSLETDLDERDDYGRLLAYVWSNGVFVNAQMVRDGYAFAREYPPNLARQEELRQAAEAAQRAGLGIWNDK